MCIWWPLWLGIVSPDAAGAADGEVLALAASEDAGGGAAAAAGFAGWVCGNAGGWYAAHPAAAVDRTIAAMANTHDRATDRNCGSRAPSARRAMPIEPDSRQELHFIAIFTPSLTAGHAATS